MRDAENMLSTAQALVATVVSDETINLVKAGLSPGLSGKLYIKMVVTTVTTGADSGMNIEVITSADEALGTPTVVQTSRLITQAELMVDGFTFQMALTPDVLTAAKKYLGLNYNFVTELPVGLVVDAWVDRHPESIVR